MINLKNASYSPKGLAKTLCWGELGWGESYVDGDIQVANLKAFLFHNQNVNKFKGLFKKTRKGREETHLHYDIEPKFYEKLLGRTKSYTGALWDGADNLDSAQRQKLQLHYENLELDSKSRLLDIGCGWGSFIDYVRGKCVVEDITGLSISKEQLNYIKQCNPNKYKLHLSSWERFRPGRKFNRVSILGCIEHIGRRNLAKFFKWLDSITTPDAIITIQCIVSDMPINDWTNRYIFPGAEPPTMHELVSYPENAGFNIDYKSLRQDSKDYAKTCEAWLENLKKYPMTEKEYRMWQLYLTGGIVTFETRNCLLTRYVLRKR